jgi:hypothetical protein
MGWASAGCVAAIVLGVSTASADILPPGSKSVRLSIHVDAEIPPGKTLVLAHTFRGADAVSSTTANGEPVAASAARRRCSSATAAARSCTSASRR